MKIASPVCPASSKNRLPCGAEVPEKRRVGQSIPHHRQRVGAHGNSLQPLRPASSPD
ncbi:hypothetical protein [Larkinella soli]|uniref:hypothetical protein n=1 Tax=Larkinella soli TaxID=1770527 RepID=UPI0019D057CE|nr:hypothetical protein [Larkinella soli]